MKCEPDMTTAKVVVNDKNIVVVHCLCTCGNSRHGFSGPFYSRNLYPIHDEEEEDK